SLASCSLLVGVVTVSHPIHSLIDGRSCGPTVCRDGCPAMPWEEQRTLPGPGYMFGLLTTLLPPSFIGKPPTVGIPSAVSRSHWISRVEDKHLQGAGPADARFAPFTHTYYFNTSASCSWR